MSDHQNSVSAEEFSISYALKGLLWAVSITVVLAVISALLLQYTALSESLLSGFATFIFFISMFMVQPSPPTPPREKVCFTVLQ